MSGFRFLCFSFHFTTMSPEKNNGRQSNKHNSGALVALLGLVSTILLSTFIRAINSLS